LAQLWSKNNTSPITWGNVNLQLHFIIIGIKTITEYLLPIRNPTNDLDIRTKDPAKRRGSFDYRIPMRPRLLKYGSHEQKKPIK